MKSLKEIILSKKIQNLEIEGKQVPDKYISVFNSYLEQIAESLAEHDEQVRKEVCERLDKIIEKYLCKKGRYRESLDISSMIKQVMKENLDQIQGE